jgi:hypothetical protein
MTVINDDLQREIGELVQSAELWLDSIGRRVTAEHADWVVGYAALVADIRCRAAAASPFPDDASPTRKRASSQRRDAFWADPQHQALTQEDDANADPIPSAR